MRWKTATVLAAIALAALLLLKYGPHQAPPGTRRAAGDVPEGAALWLYRPLSAEWVVWTQAGGARVVPALGPPGGVPVRTQRASGQSWFGTFHPDTGVWRLRDGFPGTITWGQRDDVPVPADYVGDSTVDVGVWRPSTGAWLIRDGATGQVTNLLWGTQGDVPVPADYDGDGRTDPAVWRPSDGGWHVATLDGRALASAVWGRDGDIPVPGNYSGDRAAELAVFRPSGREWYVRTLQGATLPIVQFGAAGDVPAPADIEGAGMLSPGVWEPARATWRVHRREGPPVVAVFGTPSDVPVTTVPARVSH